jgi:DNA-binding NtrC family response regulator
MPKILVVDDDKDILSALCAILRREGFEVVAAEDGPEAFRIAQTERFDAVLSDLKLGEMDGLALIRHLHSLTPELPIVLMTGHGSMDVVIRAIQMGACDYLTKPFKTPRLLEVLNQVVQSHSPSEVEFSMADGTPVPGEIVGNSLAVQSVGKEIGRMASSTSTVLILGETGTGKELVARALHRYSRRSAGAFVSINCMAIPETLLESELFGYEQGAFTGAVSRKKGLFERAVGGTIFLDEVGDTSPGIQGKLLRALQEKTIQRIGGREEIPVDVRVLAATNRDLKAEGGEGRFRDDLYFRLTGGLIRLPPLRERREDIPGLACHFLRMNTQGNGTATPTISLMAIKALEDYDWPGNVRELQNLIGQAVMRAGPRMISADDIHFLLSSGEGREPGGVDHRSCFVSQFLATNHWSKEEGVHARLFEGVERELYQQVFRQAEGRKSRMAKWLGVSRPTINEKLVKFGLDQSGAGSDES